MLNRIFRNPCILAMLSAVLLRLSYPKFDVWPLAWIAFVPLFLALEGKSPAKSFFISLLSGTAFFILTIFWLIHVTVAGMVVLSAYLGLYVAFFGWGYRFAKGRLSAGLYLLFVPAWWVLLEFIRAHLLTGFPWAMLAYSQTRDLCALQAADIFGAYGVSFIVMLTNILVFELIRRPRSDRPLPARWLAAGTLIVLFWLAYGAYRLGEDPKRSCGLRVAMVQGNIPQEIKWVSRFRENILKKYQLLTEIVTLKDDPDLVVWPETSLPDYFELGDSDDLIKEFFAKTDTPLLVGSIRLQEGRYFNSAILVSSLGQLQGFYDKIHLVPFGEYIPGRMFFPFLARIVPIEDISPGTSHKIFSVETREKEPLAFGVLICFEDIMAPLASELVRRGADFLVNMTNDAWFGDTASPYQHMQASVCRAVENRAYVVRAANTGVSCIIDDAGRVVEMVKDDKGKETFVTGYKTGVVYKTQRRSLYTRLGDLFAFVCVCYCVLAMTMVFLRRKT